MSHHPTWFFAAACLALAASNAAAQDWPSRPMRAIVPVAAGSSTDIVPRLVLEQLLRISANVTDDFGERDRFERSALSCVEWIVGSGCLKVVERLRG